MQPARYQPIYDPARTYDDNFDNGPFGGFLAPKVYKNAGEPKYSFLGYPVHLPFGIAAGPLLNAKYVKSALDMGFDVVCYKTQRSKAYDCNPFPNVVYVQVDGDLTPTVASRPLVGQTHTDVDPTKLTITNSFGMPSRGPDFWVSDLKAAMAHARPGQLVYVSVVGTIRPGMSKDDYFNDFAETAALAASTEVKAIEINLSCPNVANEGILCYTPSAVAEICRRTKQAIGNVPLMIKVGYYTQVQESVLQAVMLAAAPYIAAVSAINTIPAAVVDQDGKQALPGPNRLRSGLCGASIKWAGLDMATRLASLRSKLKLSFEIVGVGGVMTPADYQEFRAAGADVVQSCTGAMWNPNLAMDIKLNR